MTWLLGILGAVAAVLYWRFAVVVDLPLALDWLSVGRVVLIYAATGFVVGWLVGFALGKIGADY